MYIIQKEKARNALPAYIQPSFDDIVEQRVLGASTHIAMIGDMIEAICEDAISSKITSLEIVERIEEVTNYFIHTRGEASQAITNAIHLMIHDLQKCVTLDCKQAIEKIIATKNQYTTLSKEASDKAINYAVEIGDRLQCILVYDYSSSVDMFLRRLHEKKCIYIAESRVMNGGKPFVNTCMEAGHEIHFIPDAALMYYMKECEAVFMGAETILPDGTGYNTTGSDIVGMLCKYYHIPLYFISPLIKSDVRCIEGKTKSLVFTNLYQTLAVVANPEGNKGIIDYTSPELVGVPAHQITAFITELGVIPSHAMYDICSRYIKDLKGGL